MGAQISLIPRFCVCGALSGSDRALSLPTDRSHTIARVLEGLERLFVMSADGWRDDVHARARVPGRKALFKMISKK